MRSRLFIAGAIVLISLSVAFADSVTTSARQSPATPERPVGTLREQAALQQSWLKQRLDTLLPPLMRKYGIDMWVVPMREYNEDPVFTAIVAPETFAARRRTMYVFFDKCAAAGAAVTATCIERLALGGSSQGGIFEARTSTRQVTGGGAVRGRQAELWGDEQWELLKTVIEERKPRIIGINRSTMFAFTDGLSSGELDGMSRALGPAWTAKFKDAERLPLDLIASRVAAEEAFFQKMTGLVWEMTQTMFSSKVIQPGKTRTSDLVWWWRQRVNDQGLGTWFQPSVDVQRQGSATLESDPVILPGDVLHCDVGITVARLNTDTQHLAYVLKPGETDAPAGLRQHGAGPLIGLWDRQEGVPGRGDATVIPSMWYSIELQATTPVPEWGGQPVRMAQEEDAIVGADGTIRWALRRQDRLFLVK